MLLECLKGISPFASVFELGCGFGRITRLILSNSPEVKDYVAVDISPDQITNAKKYVMPETAGRNLAIEFIVSDIQSLEEKRRFDLVIASEVLLHILPREVEGVMSKLVGLSKRHVINIDAYQDPAPKDLAPHNFIHPYEEMYRRMPEIESVVRIPIVKRGTFSTVDAKQSIFHATVRPDHA
jgi:SAM-dependent methyltransferase